MVHLRENGFNVIEKDLPDVELAELKAENGIAPQYRSCHTAFVGDYFVEGHVPAEVIHDLLADQPDIRGLALPGMPSGSPGMDGPKRAPFEILSFDMANEVAPYVAH